MAISRSFLAHVLVLTMAAAFFNVHASEFYVGGSDGWTQDPREDYNHWAERTRFTVNDSLVFKYMQGADSVLLVKIEDYETCNTQNPIKRMDDGNSTLSFDRSGSFYFISGRPGSCWTGQKLWVVVMAIRKPIPSPSPSPSTTYPPRPSPSPNSDKGAPSPASTSSSPAILTDVVSLSLAFMLSASAFFLGKLQN